METTLILTITIAVLGLLSYGISKVVFHLIRNLLERDISFSAIFTTTCIAVASLSVLLLFRTMTFYNSPVSQNRPLDRLVEGKMAFDIPDTMEIEENYKAIVTITKALNDSILFQDIDRRGFHEQEIKISSRVKVFLIDPTGNKNFNITALNTEEQLVDDSTNTVWRWNIIPIRGGDHELVLRTTVKVLDYLGENYKDITVFEKSIKVNASIVVTTKQFIGDYWQWLTTVCFIPLLIWGYKRFSNRKDDNDKRQPIGFKTEKKNENGTKQFSENK